jgi:hypothetical protein
VRAARKPAVDVCSLPTRSMLAHERNTIDAVRQRCEGGVLTHLKWTRRDRPTRKAPLAIRPTTLTCLALSARRGMLVLITAYHEPARDCLVERKLHPRNRVAQKPAEAVGACVSLEPCRSDARRLEAPRASETILPCEPPECTAAPLARDVSQRSSLDYLPKNLSPEPTEPPHGGMGTN